MKKIFKISVTFVIFQLLLSSVITATAIIEIDEGSMDFSSKMGSLNDKIFDMKISLLMRLGRYPSVSTCIIKNGSVVWYKGYGYSKLLLRQKPTKDIIYPLFSISKTFTSTALMQLYDKGLFDLDDDVNDYLDFEVRNPNYPDIPITFRMLLAHQSSLDKEKKRDFLPSSLLTLFWKNPDEYPYPIIKDFITPNGKYYDPTLWENYPPGTECNYSGWNMVLIDHLVEVLSNQKFTDYCRENIFEPLNMYNTSFHVKDLNRRQLAACYQNIGRFYFHKIAYPDSPYGIGGLKASIEDLSHYTIAHMNGGVWNGFRILNESTVEMMQTLQYPGFSNNGNKSSMRFGLGWCIWKEYNGTNVKNLFMHGHGGGSHPLGATSMMYINISNDWAVLFSINRGVNFYCNKEFDIYLRIVESLFVKAINF